MPVERWKAEPDKTRRPNRAPGGGLPELEFQLTVEQMCAWQRLYCYHTHDSRASARGFPDLVIIGPNGILFRELKTETGKVRSDQAEVLALISAAGGDASVWRPSDLAHGVIQAELKAIGGRKR